MTPTPTCLPARWFAKADVADVDDSATTLDAEGFSFDPPGRMTNVTHGGPVERHSR